MYIDTTTAIANYHPNIKNTYFKNCLNLRNEFCKWIDKIGEKKNLDWWISNPASRNYNFSKLFHFFCLIETIKKEIYFINQNSLIVDNQAIKDVLKKQLKIKSNIQVREENLFNFINNFLIILKSFIFHSIVYFFSKIGKERKIPNKKKLTLIDTFLEDANLNNNRFYSNFFLKITSKKKNIFFIPSFYLGMGLIETIKKIINCKKNQNFLLKENFLSFKDLIKSLTLIFRRKQIKMQVSKLRGVDYKMLIKKELYSNTNLSSQILGWQNYLFFKKIKKKKFKVKKSINWFENQAKDKGWNLGVRTFFPKAKSYGYQGFTVFPQYIMGLNPSSLEYKSKVIPETILSIGKNFNQLKKEFCDKLKIKTVPALNFQHIYKKKKIQIKNKKNILLILTGFLDDDVNLINWLINSNIHKSSYKIFIKEHPILKIKNIKKNIKNFPKHFKIIKKNFWNSVNFSGNLICTGSTSALIELIISGRFCIIPKLNPYDGEVLKKLNIKNNFLILDEPEELIHNLKNHKIKKFSLKNYFTRLSEENIKIFL